MPPKKSTDSPITFRLEKDPSLLARLNEHVHSPHAEKHPDIFAPYDYNRFLPWYEAMLSKDTSEAVVVYDGDRPVGYALLLHRKSGDNPLLAPGYEWLSIDQMGIIPAYRAQGIGTLLMNFIFELCRERRIGRIQLSVWIDNEAARAFYEKMGFQGFLLNMELLTGSS